MGRETVIVEYCDVTHDEKTPAEHTDVMVLDGKPLTLLQCDEHYKRRLTMSQWGAQFAEFGWEDVQTEQGKPPRTSTVFHRSDELTCPECKKTIVGRTSTLNHLVSIHGYDKVEASKRIKPSGVSIICSICGFVASVGTGFSAHVRTEHGDEVFEQLKAEGKTSPTRKAS